MPKIDAKEVRALLDYDPDTGKFTWRKRQGRNVTAWNAEHAGKPAGQWCNTGGLWMPIKGKYYHAETLAWAWMHGEWPTGKAYHINGDRMDNRAINLRVEGARRLRLRYTGATYDKQTGKWKSQIFINGKNVYLGRFDTPEDAHEAYLHAADTGVGVQPCP
jgi:hypothetical protein